MMQNYINAIDSMKTIKNPVYAVAEENYASKFYQIIVDRINDFDKNLDETKEVGIKLVTFGQAITFSVTGIGYNNPSTIIFHGITENDEPVELIQHVTQLSFLLMGIKRINPTEPKKRIGFIYPNENQEL